MEIPVDVALGWLVMTRSQLAQLFVDRIPGVDRFFRNQQTYVFS